MGYLMWGITSAAGAAAAAAGNTTLALVAITIALAALAAAFIWRIGQPDREHHRRND